MERIAAEDTAEQARVLAANLEARETKPTVDAPIFAGAIGSASMVYSFEATESWHCRWVFLSHAAAAATTSPDETF